ncbi:Gfo/Idh/MocA family oxidoreductase [Aquabacterium sp.]|uniref:Gfo/Idh/MocA family protein n=1 Tax=Aquabacterium sp. TaxID=1872578 RepID=UPI0025C486F8|nr:Gfo/Idh/MocA family oxidoreductase [Aquabacterium sp.]
MRAASTRADSLQFSGRSIESARRGLHIHPITSGKPVLKVAVIGCGKIADGHVEQIRAIGRGEVVAVCDREPLMVEQLAVRMKVPGRYTDAAEMLRVERPDVVHIATPPESHVMLACMALRAGCHVFVEKPFALNAADAQVILDCASEVGKRVSVNYLYNFEPPGLMLEPLLARGALGDLVHLDTQYGYNLGGDYGLAVMSDPNHWVHRLPGKLFHNVLDHVLAKVVAHIGDDAAVQVLSFRRRPASGVPTLDALPDELRFMLRSGAVTVSGLVSAHGRPAAHTLRVVGTRDSVDLDYTARTLVHSANWSQPASVGRLFPAFVQARQFWRNGWRNVGLFRRHEYHYFECMRVLLSRFYDAIEHQAADPIPPDHIRRVCRVIDQIVEGMEAAR